MTELTELLGCELTPIERSLIGFGESRGARQERERIIAMLLDGWARNENAPIIKAIKGEQQ